MSNPSVTATIAVDDKASPVLKELARLGKTVAQDVKGGNGNAYANTFSRASAAAREHIGALTSIRNLHREIGGIIAGIAGSKLYQSARAAISNFLPYEKDVRYQTAIQGFGAADQKMLDAQRVDAARRFGVMPMDTLHAQQAFVTRNFSAGITKAATEQAILLSKALNTPVEEASKLVEGMTFGQGIHLKNPNDASIEMRRSSDRAAIAAKAGAMSPEDIRQFAKYGIGMSTAAGISADQAYAVAMTLKRANVGGDEAGVFMRELSSKLMSPTRAGFDALAHMGIKYEDFARQGAVSPEATDAALRRRYGKGLSEKGIEGLRGAFNDESRNVIGSREDFAAAVREAVEASGEALSKTDQKHLTDTALRQYDLAKHDFRGGALLEAILKKANAKDLNALLGSKQAGRGSMLLTGLEQYQEYLEKLAHSDGYAEKIANERMAGAAAAVDRFNASLDTASKKLVEASQGLIEKGANLATAGVGGLLNLSPERMQTLSAAGGLGIGAAALAATSSIASLASAASVAAASLLRTAGVNAASTAAGATGLAARSAGMLGVASRFMGVAGLTVAAAPFVYDWTKDEAQGVTRDHSRPQRARAAIRADATERMDRELERLRVQNEEMAQAARRGDEAMAPVIARRGGNAVYRRNLSGALDEQYGPEGGGAQTLTGEVTGQADIRITGEVKPSPWFMTTFQQMQQDIVTLKGSLGSDKTGTGMSGSNGAKPAFNPATNAP